jgi:DNA polymerase-3 subunit epsilon
MTFTAIDFETAQAHHICAVGIVTVEDGEIVEEYHSLIQPPDNSYSWHTIQVHGIYPEDTENSPSFVELYPEIKKRLKGRIVVAHNEPFDRNVLKKSMNDNGIPYSDLDIAERWEDTVKIYRAKGFKPANLAACCQRMNIELNHHEALSDARACAKLYLAK